MKSLLLAAGLGTRLRPLTEDWPKCLMPIHGRPLLEYWLGILWREGITDVLVNLHHHAEIVGDFVRRPRFQKWVQTAYEKELFGTAGTLRGNVDFFRGEPLLLVHADNWSCCQFSEFIAYHHDQRPQGTVMTMMTFECPQPSSCGIVELDEEGVVIGFHEKVEYPPGNLANAAVYILEPEVLEWIAQNTHSSDFSLDVLPHFVGRIATWNNDSIHKDIGTVQMLLEAQHDSCQSPPWKEVDRWQREFANHPIHKQLSLLKSEGGVYG